MTPRGSLWSGRRGLAFAAMLLVSGFSSTFPGLLPALLAELGGSRAATAAAAGLLWVGGAVLGPAAGWLVARSNPRVVVATGLACAAGGLAAGALAPSLPVLVLAVGVGGGIGVGLTGMAAQAASWPTPTSSAGGWPWAWPSRAPWRATWWRPRSTPPWSRWAGAAPSASLWQRS